MVGDIYQIRKSDILINHNKNELLLPREEQIPYEKYKKGETIRAIIKKVHTENKGSEIVVSRGDKQFLIRLFELEVPEIYDGIVEIKNVAREAGERAKIAVESIDRRVDAVGACVGMKGVRIQAIVKELINEKIDIINYSSEPAIFISRALTPVKPVKIIINEEEKLAVEIVTDDQMALAIGKNGQNLRLASELSGYQIEPVKESDYEVQISGKYIDIDEVEELPEKLKKKLIDAEINSVNEVRDIGIKGLLNLPGIGKKTAEKILQIIDKYEESKKNEIETKQEGNESQENNLDENQS